MVADLWINKILEPLKTAGEFFYKLANLTGFLESKGWSSFWALIVGIPCSIIILCIPAIILKIVIKILKNL